MLLILQQNESLEYFVKCIQFYSVKHHKIHPFPFYLLGHRTEYSSWFFFYMHGCDCQKSELTQVSFFCHPNV